MKRKMGKGKVKGTVLFTVVTVMLVMVVLLMTTLTLTTSAKRRSYYTYFESQAQYAANAAIDAVTFSAYNDDDFHTWVTTDLDQIHDVGEIRVNFDGSDIQFTQNTNNTVRCEIEKINPEVVWDDATQALHPRDMWRITATASVGNGRNISTASVSQYLYENFQAPVQSLPVSALNTGNYTVRRIVTTQQQQQTQPTPTYSSPAMLSFGNTGFVNNNMTLGPCYSNLATLPLGMFRRNGNQTYYESIDSQDKYFKGEYNESRAGKDDYNLYITNDKMMSVGNVIFVNNVYMRVKMMCEFQDAREGAVIYGDLNGDNQGMHFISNVKNVSAGDFTEKSNYVYVDGIVRITTDAGQVIVGEAPSTAGAQSYPINLYCGGIQTGVNGGRKISVSGDVYMYNPDVESTWCHGDGVTPLTKFTDAQVNKVANVSDYPGGCGGNIICNNKSLSLGGGNGTFDVPGDIVMTQAGSHLYLADNVRVAGNVITPGEVHLTGNASIAGQTISGNAAWGTINTGYYNAAYQASQNHGQYDLSLMPYISRLDELFQTYYRWDLYESTAAAASAHISTDPYIKESIAAGHTDASGHGWSVKEFKMQDGSSLYVPFTTCASTYWMIPTHTYVKPADAIGNIVANGTQNNYLSYAGFTGGTALTEYSGSTSNILAVAHDASGVMTATTDNDMQLNGYYVVNSSCEIDTHTYNKIFVDPSALQSNQELKIVLKGDCGGSGQMCDIVVNNTAAYSNNGYGSPAAYASNNRFAGRTQVRFFLKEGFGHTNANLMIRTTGIMKQWKDKNLCVVQRPTYPDDANWANLTGGLKYAYELVPNFTIYGEAGATYDFSVSNQVMLNADVAMPCSTWKFGTVNGTGDEAGAKSVTYYETASSSPSMGSNYLWAVGSFMLDTLDLNDRSAVTAYIGSMGQPSTTPPSQIIEGVGGDDSDANGENRNQNFNNSHRGAA